MIGSFSVLIFVFGFKITELMLLSTLLAAFLCTAGAFAPGNGPRDQTNRGTLPLSATALPQMEPRWQMNQSTIIMPCNNSGYMDPARTVGWSIIDFDWSNGKAIWTKQRPVREQRPLTLCGRRVLSDAVALCGAVYCIAVTLVHCVGALYCSEGFRL